MNTMPVVFNYMDARSFLMDYFNYRKRSDAGFSYEAWSQELMYSSRSYLRMVLIGKKKISEGFVTTLCRALALSKVESEYLEILVRYSQAGSQSQKQAYNQKMFQILRNQTGQSEVADYAEFVQTPFLPRLLTLLSFQDINPIPETFARIMCVELSNIQNGLKKLREMGLAQSEVVDGQVQWKSLKRRFKVPDQVGSQAMINFHEQSLKEASRSLSLSKENRKFKSLLLPLNPDELAQLYTLLDSFASEQIARFNSDNYQERRLYQMNLNIHSITEPEQKV